MRRLLPVLGLALVLAPSTALASITIDSAATAASAGTLLNASNVDYTLASYIGLLIQALFGLLGVIFLILTVYAGILWMTAGGNTDNVKKAKQILGNATIGLILTLASYAISLFVIGLAS